MRSRLPGALAGHRPSSSCAQTSAFKPGGCYFALAAAASPASVPNWDRCTSSEPLPILMTANATTDPKTDFPTRTENYLRDGLGRRPPITTLGDCGRSLGSPLRVLASLRSGEPARPSI